LFTVLVPVATAVAQPASQPAPQGSLQQRFDMATAAYDKNDCATALPLLDALAADPHVKPTSVAAAVIMAHRGACLVRTGETDRGEPLLVAGLAAMRPHASDLALDVADAENTLGTLAASRWDHDGALAHFDAALALQRMARAASRSSALPC
jgi:hypothetical protein